MKTIKFAHNHIAPSKVVCVGRNYVAHIEELNNEMPDQAVIFIKPNSAISEQVICGGEHAIHYESELSFVILDNQLAAVGFGLDLTKRELQSQLKSKRLPWERAKAFDNSAVFSDFVAIPEGVEALSLQCWKNEQLIQHATFDLMIYKPQALLEEVAIFMSFADGDILMTGTPKGVGELVIGDHFVGQIYSGERLLLEQQWVVNHA